MVVSEIRALYNDKNDLLCAVDKRICEACDPEHKQWMLKKVEYLFENPEFPITSDTAVVSIEHRYGWLNLAGLGIRHRGMDLHTAAD